MNICLQRVYCLECSYKYCQYSLIARIVILFHFVVICFSFVFLWHLRDDAVTVAWNSLLVFPERRNVVHGAEVGAYVFSPHGSSEPCHISPQLSAVPPCFLIWCASSLSMLENPAGIWSSPQQLHADYLCAHSEIPPLCSAFHRMVRVGRDDKIIWFQFPLPRAGTPSIRLGCSEPIPAGSWIFLGMNNPQLLG